MEQNKDNPLFPIDLSIFQEHVRSSLSNIFEKVSKETLIFIIIYISRYLISLDASYFQSHSQKF